MIGPLWPNQEERERGALFSSLVPNSLCRSWREGRRALASRLRAPSRLLFLPLPSTVFLSPLLALSLLSLLDFSLFLSLFGQAAFKAVWSSIVDTHGPIARVAAVPSRQWNGSLRPLLRWLKVPTSFF